MKKSLITFACLIAFMGCASATTISFTADTTLQRQNADTNLDGTNLEVRNNGAGNFSRKTYLAADLSGQLSEGSLFKDSSIELQVQSFIGPASGSITFELYGITNNNDSWNQTTLTWNNAPENDTTSGGAMLSGATLVSSTNVDLATISVNDSLTFNGTDIDQYMNWVAGAITDPYGNGDHTGNIATFVVTASTAGSGLRFFSLDTGSVNPLISATLSTIPEPSAYAAFFGLVAFGVIASLRRCNRE